MNDTPEFQPFEPSAPPLSPAGEQPPQRQRKNAKAPAAPKQRRQRRTAPAADTTAVTGLLPARGPRKRATAKVRQPRSLKLPLATALAAAQELNPTDSAVFDKIVGILSGAAKGQRARVLAALGKVFG